MLKPLLLARSPSLAVVGKKYSSPSEWTEILNGLFMVQTVWPAVPVMAVAGTAERHRSCPTQILDRNIVWMWKRGRILASILKSYLGTAVSVVGLQRGDGAAHGGVALAVGDLNIVVPAALHRPRDNYYERRY